MQFVLDAGSLPRMRIVASFVTVLFISFVPLTQGNGDMVHITHVQSALMAGVAVPFLMVMQGNKLNR